MGIPKNSLLMLSLFTSIAGLILIYFATVNLEPKRIEISEITGDLEGRKVTTTGYLVAKREHEDGHLFLTLSDNKEKIEVPMFADLMESLGDIGISKDDFQLNGKIAVSGTLENYKGKLQIMPKSLSDVKILGE